MGAEGFTGGAVRMAWRGEFGRLGRFWGLKSGGGEVFGGGLAPSNTPKAPKTPHKEFWRGGA